MIALAVALTLAAFVLCIPAAVLARSGGAAALDAGAVCKVKVASVLISLAIWSAILGFIV